MSASRAVARKATKPPELQDHTALAQQKSLRARDAVRHSGGDQPEAGDRDPVPENSREFSALARSRPLKQSP